MKISLVNLENSAYRQLFSLVLCLQSNDVSCNQTLRAQYHHIYERRESFSCIWLDEFRWFMYFIRTFNITTQSAKSRITLHLMKIFVMSAFLVDVIMISSNAFKSEILFSGCFWLHGWRLSLGTYIVICYKYSNIVYLFYSYA